MITTPALRSAISATALLLGTGGMGLSGLAPAADGFGDWMNPGKWMGGDNKDQDYRGGPGGYGPGGYGPGGYDPRYGGRPAEKDDNWMSDMMNPSKWMGGGDKDEEPGYGGGPGYGPRPGGPGYGQGYGGPGYGPGYGGPGQGGPGYGGPAYGGPGYGQGYPQPAPPSGGPGYSAPPSGPAYGGPAPGYRNTPPTGYAPSGYPPAQGGYPPPQSAYPPPQSGYPPVGYPPPR